MKASLHWTTSDAERFSGILKKAEAPHEMIPEGKTTRFVIEVNRNLLIALLFWLGGHLTLDEEAKALEQEIKKGFDRPKPS